MTTLCSEHHQHPTKKALRIPPRKLFVSRAGLKTIGLPISSKTSDEEFDPYAADDFRMYEFKVRRCMRGRSHDWTECPFAHPGEKARRRDPRQFHYSGTVCPDFRKGSCRWGDACEFAHGVFECWLHPARYRTEPCKDGRDCKRKVCFFAHSQKELRVLPPQPSASTVRCYPTNACCCVFSNKFQCKRGSQTPQASSPTSILLGPSHLSPRSSFDLIVSYRGMLAGLVKSLEGMDLRVADSSPCSPIKTNVSWGSSINCRDLNEEWEREDEENGVVGRSCMKEGIKESDRNDNGGYFYPDVDWVNELVM